ncbi:MULTISPECIES: metalloregulator ArsR/SmtB family transcription factor [unclassified Rhodococcus (in: high G+C Gram-positive bacteria)]|uniref:helix-turn-helix domain-containing GNAT family N-acetyltransferase n=1 Tax=unclassified Rhodococcus (in: high G+C Gram-positive bacteria) TaxID=192944 RepID=UPI001639D43B|nr:MULTISPECIES: metalloregulator ArsR/SmtB family transcription factor [unclassified Rhodococcus (in: high G+C Gram-positive bacteria)]MBC2644923.1 metalloregulator ArsR/SmtB family transcription factor [Rhodococcus sp. 3A]MBC2890925.1 metalloregulator ArsR/SmtB family transcription factor [Rhodococcus sp. 4CII]
MTSLDMPAVRTPGAEQADALAPDDAATYAGWFACLADPTRVRLLHQVASHPAGITVGELAEALGIGQPTVSHHVRKLADVGFVTVHKDRTSTVVRVNPSCCTGLPHAADAVMGVLTPRPCCPDDLPDDVTVRPMREQDWETVRRIYGEGIATRTATFTTEVPTRETLDAQWLPGHRWVAEIDDVVVGWAALSPTSGRDCYQGVAENSVYVADGMRGRGVGKALLRTQVIAADEAGIWTLQTSIFPENRASIALHHSAGFRTIGVRERIAQLDGIWRDTVFLERRSALTV